MVDLNEYPSMFGKVHPSHFRHEKTTSNFLQISLKDRLRVSNEQSQEGVMYILHKPMVELGGGGPQTLFFWCKFLKILMVLDKTIHKAFKIHKTI